MDITISTLLRLTSVILDVKMALPRDFDDVYTFNRIYI